MRARSAIANAWTRYKRLFYFSRTPRIEAVRKLIAGLLLVVLMVVFAWRESTTLGIVALFVAPLLVAQLVILAALFSRWIHRWTKTSQRLESEAYAREQEAQ